VAETRARSGKARLLADCLRELDGEEVEIAVLYLSGEIRQGRIGIGPSVLRACMGDAALTASLDLLDVDRAFEELAAISGRSFCCGCSRATCARAHLRA
jgi:DNA ligase-1